MFTGLDIALLAIMLLSALVGVLRGMLVEVLGVVIWVAAGWVAFKFGDDVAPLFAPHVTSETIQLGLGYGATFIVVIIAGSLLNILLGKLVKSSGLSGTDRLLGLLFGIVRGAAIACVVVLIMGFMPFQHLSWWKDSMLLPYARHGATWMKGWLPERVANSVVLEDAPKVPFVVEQSLKMLPKPKPDANESLEVIEDDHSQAPPPSSPPPGDR